MIHTNFLLKAFVSLHSVIFSFMCLGHDSLNNSRTMFIPRHAKELTVVSPCRYALCVMIELMHGMVYYCLI